MNADNTVVNLMDQLDDNSSVEKRIVHDSQGQLINARGFAREIRNAVSQMEQYLDSEDVDIPEEVSNRFGELIEDDLVPCLDYLEKSIEELGKKVTLLSDMLKQKYS